MKKKFLAFLLLLNFSLPAIAAGPSFPLDKAPDQTNNMAALQNGAKIFANYCLGCHSASFVRFSHLEALDLTKKQIAENLMFTTDKIGGVMKANIDPIQAKKWFGVNPPDLSLIARSRSSSAGSGADYLYSFLRSYYRDGTKVSGWNNLVFPDVAMPNPFWQLQGERSPIFEQSKNHGHSVKTHVGWQTVTPGAIDTPTFDENIANLVSYLQWMADPQKNNRTRIGIWVLLFLLLLTIVTWRMNAAFWKDIK